MNRSRTALVILAACASLLALDCRPVVEQATTDVPDPTATAGAEAGDAGPASSSSAPSAPAQEEGSDAQDAAIAASADSVALVGGRILDGFGGPPIENGVVLIEGERIVAVGSRAQVEVPGSFEQISTEGMTVLPGLIDMHVHLMILGHGIYERWHRLYDDSMVDVVMPIAARQLLEAGVTTVRDLGAEPGQILEVRRRIDAGEILGPRLFVSGPFLQRASYTEWEEPYRWGVASVAQARQVVQDLARRGIDVIKLIDQDEIDDDVVAAIVNTAHDNGLPVYAHAHRMEEIRVGLRHGVDGFEHTGLGTAPGYPEDVLEGLRERNAAIFWTPTISPLFTMRYSGEIFPERLDDPSWRRHMPPAMADEIRASLDQVPHLPYYALFPSRIPLLAHKFGQIRATGVRLLIGTDAGIPTMFHNDSTWREMALWVELGVSPMEVIQSATLWPARALRADDEIGTLTAGRLADLIAVRGDPLTDIALLRRPDIVIKGGQRVR